MSTLPEDRHRPLIDRLPRDPAARGRIIEAHEAARLRSDPGYLDPASGLVVMTASYLWDRGECCDSGCRHCPFAEGERSPI